MCNLPVVVTAVLRKAGRTEDDSDAATKSTFGWRVATVKTTGTVDSGTAMDLRTINLRDLAANTAVTNPTLSQFDQGRAVDIADLPSLGHKDDVAARAKQQRSIVWITPEKLRRSDEDEETYHK